MTNGTNPAAVVSQSAVLGDKKGGSQAAFASPAGNKPHGPPLHCRCSCHLCIVLHSKLRSLFPHRAENCVHLVISESAGSLILATTYSLTLHLAVFPIIRGQIPSKRTDLRSGFRYIARLPLFTLA